MGGYYNAERILPPELFEQVQEYAAGKQLYVPCREGERVRWGERNGVRAGFAVRNAEIRRLHALGHSKEQLAERYALSVETIRKLVRKKRRGDD